MLKLKNNRNLFMCGIVLLIIQFITLAVRAISYAVVKGTTLTVKAIIPTTPERFVLFWGMGVIGLIAVVVSCVIKLGNEYCRDAILSTKEKTRKLVVCSLLLALAAVVSLIEIMPIQEMKITFTYLLIALCGHFYGITTAMAFGAAADLLGYIVNPAGGMLFPGFTVTALISGMFYGLFLYKKYTPQGKMPLWRVIAAKSADTLICNIILNTFCCSVLYGETFIALLPARVMKNLILLPFEIAVLFFVIKFAQKHASEI